MEQTPPMASAPQPTEQPPPPQPPPPTSSSSSSLSTISASLPSTSSAIPSSPNPNPSQKPTTSQLPQPQSQQPQQQPTIPTSQTKPPLNRPWQQPSHFSHLSSHLPSVPTSHPSSSSPSPPPVPPFSASASSSVSTPPAQRGGMAVGVPVHHHNPPAPPTSFSSLTPPSFGQQFGGLARNPVNVSESVAGSSSSQMRQPIQGMQGVGTVGSFGSSSQMRQGGIASHHQQRPVQSTLRPQTSSNNQSSASQNFQGHGLLRVPSVGSPGSPSPSTSQSLQPHNQPWLSSGSQGKPPLPSPSFRPQMTSQSLPQRSHIPQHQHHPISTTSQQQMPSAQQVQQSLPSQPAQEHYGQQFPASRVPQSLSHQQQITRGPLVGNQKPSLHGMQPSTVQLAPVDKTASADTSESINRIVSKRSIQELVSQIDPSERLDPEVEDILVDIADDFVESITTFGCSLAKHRKSSTLEAKDVLLHLERNWNMSLPGFRGDEIKGYRKQLATDIHRERLAVIKKSMSSADTAGTKSSGGQAAGNAKGGHLAKAPMNVIGSPNSKIGEAA